MSTTRPLFGTRQMYELLAQRVNDDPEWLQRAGHMTYTMTHVYTEPVNRSFSVRIEAGRLVEIAEHDGPAPGDFVLTASPEDWEQVATGELDAKRAIVAGQIQASGDKLTLLKHVVVLKKLVDHLGDLDLSSEAHAAA